LYKHMDAYNSETRIVEITLQEDTEKPVVNFDFETNKQNGRIDIKQLLSNMLSNSASDLHLKSPMGPVYRIDGELIQ
jgi:hypothetical protein